MTPVQERQLYQKHINELQNLKFKLFGIYSNLLLTKQRQNEEKKNTTEETKSQ